MSLSLDHEPDDLTTYRAGTWKMPWRHAFLSAGNAAPVARAFRVRGIPALVLVGPDGRIAAAGQDTRGEWLLTTLETQLGDAVPDHASDGV